MEERSRNRKKLIKISSKLFVVGTWYKEKNILQIKNILEIDDVHNNKLHCFKRLFKDSIIFETESRSVNKKKINSTCIKYFLNNEEQIGFINYFVKVCKCQCISASNCNNCNSHCKIYAIISKYSSERAFSTQFNKFIPTIYKCSIYESENIVAIEAENIKNSCYKIMIANHTYAIEPSNCVENE